MRKECGACFGFPLQTCPIACFGASKLGVMREGIGGELRQIFSPDGQNAG
jgi:hypothetical protein